MDYLLTTDNVKVEINKFVYYIGSNYEVQKRKVTKFWLHGDPFRSYKQIYSTYLKCFEAIKNIKTLN